MASHAEDLALNRFEKGSEENLKENAKLIKEIDEVRAARRKEAEESGEEVRSELKPLSHERTDAQDMEEHRPADGEARKPAKEVPSKKAAEQSDEPDGNVSLTIEERMDLMEQELELEKLKGARWQAKAKKFERTASRHAGALNHVRQSSNSESYGTGDDDLWSELFDEEENDHRQTNTDRVDLSEFEQETLTAARQGVTQQFLNDHDDIYDGKDEERALSSDFTAAVAELRPDYDDDLNSGSPKRVRKATQSLLKEARMTLQEKRMEASLADARKRRAIVSTKARERKLASQASEGSSQSDNEADTRDFENLSADEMSDRLARDKKRSGYY